MVGTFTFLLVIFMLLVQPPPAQCSPENLKEKLAIGGQIRIRSELDRKSFAPGSEADDFTLLRTRLGLRFEPEDNTSVYLQFQDSRSFGSEGSTLTNSANVDLHQAFLQVDHLFGLEGLSAMAGRMEISFGDERLIGPVGWSNVGRSFDGARLFLDRKKCRAEVWGARVNELYSGSSSRDNSVLGFDLELYRTAGFSPRAYLILERNDDVDGQNRRLLSRQTVGVQASGRNGTLDYGFETALQRGTQAGNDIKAYLVALSAGYTFNSPAKPRLALGLDYLSGDDDPAHGKIKTFNTLYATNHKFYGHMDYFLDIPASTNGRGLVDYMLKARGYLHPGWLAGIDFHLFRYAEPDLFGESALGRELDLNLTFDCRKTLSNVIGFSAFAPDGVFERTRGKKTAYWLYYMLTAAF